MTMPQLTTIDWTRFEPGGEEYQRKYTPVARQTLYVRVVAELAKPVRRDTKAWRYLSDLAPRFGLPGPREVLDREFLDYLQRCLNVWEDVLNPG
jgi:hypothetical protein